MKSWRLAAALPLLFCFLSAARAEWKVDSLERELGANGAVEYRRYSLGEEETGANAEVRLAFFSNQNATLRVIDQPGFDHSLAETMTRENCSAGVNGGYFDPDGAPVGLLRAGGKTIAPLRKARLLSGVLAVGSSGAEIFRASDFPAKRNWREALQCGPFLLDHGRPVAGLNDTRVARRTFVFTTRDQHTAIGFCAPVTLARLADILAAFSDLRISRALNLDGGSSSAFWCRTTKQAISISENKAVRDFLAVGPRPSR